MALFGKTKGSFKQSLWGIEIFYPKIRVIYAIRLSESVKGTCLKMSGKRSFELRRAFSKQAFEGPAKVRKVFEAYVQIDIGGGAIGLHQ